MNKFNYKVILLLALFPLNTVLASKLEVCKKTVDYKYDAVEKSELSSESLNAKQQSIVTRLRQIPIDATNLLLQELPRASDPDLVMKKVERLGAETIRITEDLLNIEKQQNNKWQLLIAKEDELHRRRMNEAKLACSTPVRKNRSTFLYSPEFTNEGFIEVENTQPIQVGCAKGSRMTESVTFKLNANRKWVVAQRIKYAYSGDAVTVTTITKGNEQEHTCLLSKNPKADELRSNLR